MKWLTVPMVMAELNLTQKVTYSLIRSGKLEAIRTPKAYRISQQALDEFCARALVQPAVRVPLPVSRVPRRRPHVTRGVECQLPGADFFVRKKQGLH